MRSLAILLVRIIGILWVLDAIYSLSNFVTSTSFKSAMLQAMDVVVFGAVA